ncbi:MAG: hypothetical protein LBQ86_01115 [Holophagales bacterium]|jgi:hypothetical protein|nr:hypothetical protein [Holophagales bacterium]
MDINTDWRIRNQMNYLKGVRLVHSKYIQPREDWDHDHCEFCTDKIDASTGMAYYTKDTHHWICEECYADFKELFEWKLE